jgi:hypothetical protein
VERFVDVSAAADLVGARRASTKGRHSSRSERARYSRAGAWRRWSATHHDKLNSFALVAKKVERLSPLVEEHEKMHQRAIDAFSLVAPSNALRLAGAGLAGLYKGLQWLIHHTLADASTGGRGVAAGLERPPLAVWISCLGSLELKTELLRPVPRKCGSRGSSPRFCFSLTVRQPTDSTERADP